MELYKKYRPKKLKDVLGQEGAITTLQVKLKRKNVPHTILFHGPSGCGKTTLARIMRRALKCSKADFYEINGADKNGIELVREIRSRMMSAPLDGLCRVWLIDECHKLSSAAQDGFLKLLEDTPRHVYFFLCTTNKQKVKPTIRTRSTEIFVKSLTPAVLSKVLADVCKAEKITLPKKVKEKILEIADGSGRKALVLLDQVYQVEDSKMMSVIEEATAEVQGITIARALISPSTNWKKMAQILKDTSTEDPESIRWMVLGYCRAVLLGGGKLADRAFIIIDAFSHHFYDTKHAGLAAACYEVITEGK